MMISFEVTLIEHCKLPNYPNEIDNSLKHLPMEFYPEKILIRLILMMR